MQHIITPDFVAFLRDQFLLDWKGIHGVSHWARVRRNGLLIAQDHGADTRVIEYFSFLHDSRRFDCFRLVIHGAEEIDLLCFLAIKCAIIAPQKIKKG